MAVSKSNSNSTCKTKTSKDDKANNLVKVLTATEIEIKYARHLADNNPKVRKGALKMLKRWFMKRGAVIDKDFSILWSGLYITFWMSDKPLVQEECAESIAALSNVLNSKMSLKFFESAFSRLSMEWYGIDQLRMDKFLMLVRRLLRKYLQVLATAEYNADVMAQHKKILSDILCSGPSVNNLGLKLHLADIYLEEIAKTQPKNIEPSTVTQLLQPFIDTLCIGKDQRLLGEVAKTVFRQLMRQSNEGLEFADKYKAWRQLGFPGGDISCMQLNKDSMESDEDDEEQDDESARGRVLDPRAGRVNVDLPQIRFDAKEISDLLFNGKFDENATSKNRKIVDKLIKEFRTLATGEYPLNKNQQTVDLPQKEKGVVKRSANALIDFEEKIQNGIKKNRKRRKEENTTSADESINKRLKKNEESKTDNNMSNVQDNIKYKEPKKKLMNGALNLDSNNDLQMVNSLKYVKHRNKQSIKSQVHLDIEACNYEWKFKRPSGTWYVFKGSESPTKVTSKKVGSDFYIEHDNAAQGFTIEESNAMPSRTPDSKSKFKSEVIEGSIKCTKGDLNSFTTPFATIMKGDKSAEKSKREKSSKLNATTNSQLQSTNKKLSKAHKITTPQPIVKQNSPKHFTTPKNKRLIIKDNFMKSSDKKVKIALNLNQSQEIHEHELQVKTSPAIPFDANKKPLKPLLKPQCGRFSMSPINPFFKSLKQRRSLMF